MILQNGILCPQVQLSSLLEKMAIRPLQDFLNRKDTLIAEAFAAKLEIFSKGRIRTAHINYLSPSPINLRKRLTMSFANSSRKGHRGRMLTCP